MVYVGSVFQIQLVILWEKAFKPLVGYWQTVGITHVRKVFKESGECQ